MSGTSPRTVTAKLLIPSPPTKVDTTSVSSFFGGVPARARPADRAIEKQLESAAAISSSGLVPADASSARAPGHRLLTVTPLPSVKTPDRS